MLFECDWVITHIFRWMFESGLIYNDTFVFKDW